MKNDRIINGKIIKMDEDTITVITKTQEMIIDKEDVSKIYYSEQDYEEDRKKVTNKIEIKDDNKAPYIVKVDPPNGGKNILASRCKVWEITFNEPMEGGGFNIYFSHKIKQMTIRWVNQKRTYQITFNEELRPDTEYKILLNKTNEPRSDIRNMKGIYVKHDTIVSFKTASAEMEKKFLKIQKQVENVKGIDESKKAWLGIKTENLNNNIKKQLNIKPLIRGIIIKEVMENSPAEKAGLKENDIIQSLFNEKIYTSEYFNFFINNLYLGAKIKLKIYRDGKVIEQEIILDIDQKK